jgi:hypothetical protein
MVDQGNDATEGEKTVAKKIKSENQLSQCLY